MVSIELSTSFWANYFFGKLCDDLIVLLLSLLGEECFDCDITIESCDAEACKKSSSCAFS